MSLTPGTRLGVYEITALIGVGGMGEVYKATDTNLKRAVAIKVLPALVAADTERLARFQREAEVLAALNHPNIAQIHGLEKSAGIAALVMELVEGDDLSQRISRGAIPLDEALPIAKQIAEALGSVGDPDGNALRDPRVSPTGRRIVVSRTVQGNQDLWLLDGARMSRFTFDPAQDAYPVRSPAGSRIAFRSLRTSVGDVYQKLTNGVGVEEPLAASDQSRIPTSWSADGRFLLYNVVGPAADNDLGVLPMALREPQGHPEQGRGMVGDRTPSVFLKTPFRELWGAFSPDGRWVAYQSNESGRQEIYVRPFVPPSPDASADRPGGQWQVSTAGGIMPVWRRDGKELFYLNPAGAMMAAPITVTGSTLEPGAPVVLFPTRIVGGGVDAQQGRQYDVAPDGRFLLNTELEGATAPITLIQNWNPEAKR